MLITMNRRLNDCVIDALHVAETRTRTHHSTYREEHVLSIALNSRT